MEVRITPEELLVLSFPGADRSIRMEDLQLGNAMSRRYRKPADRRVPEGTGPGGRPIDGRAEDPPGDAQQRLTGAEVRGRRRSNLVSRPAAGAPLVSAWGRRS